LTNTLDLLVVVPSYLWMERLLLDFMAIASASETSLLAVDSLLTIASLFESRVDWFPPG
jgi:hypothetical protein